MARYFNEVNPDGPLAGTKCPVSPGRLRELYEGGWREEDGKRVWCEPMSQPEIARFLGYTQRTVSIWMHKCAISIRTYPVAGKIAAKKYDFKGKVQQQILRGLMKRVTLKQKEASLRSQPKAVAKAVEMCKQRRIKCVCSNPNCQKKFDIPPSAHRKGEGKYCSAKCADLFRARKGGLARRGKSCFTDIWCPECAFPSLCLNSFNRHGKRRFLCIRCGRNTVVPLLEEPAPRQVLERHRELRAQGITLREVPALEGRP